MLPRRAFIQVASLCSAVGLAYGSDRGVLNSIGMMVLEVADLQSSLTFYQQLFADSVRIHPQLPQALVQVGSNALLLRQSTNTKGQSSTTGEGKNPISTTSQTIIYQSTIVFNITKTVSQLRSYLAGQDLQFFDDGELLQLSDSDNSEFIIPHDELWPEHLEPWVEVSVQKPVFSVLGLDEVSIIVSNLEVDALYYARLLDTTASVVAGAHYFSIGDRQLLRLTQAPRGIQPGLSAFGLQLQLHDMGKLADAVFQLGGIVEQELANGFSCWDPNGYRLMLRQPPLV
jgi:hypothetical protein